MSDETGLHRERWISEHVAVRLDHYILVFGGVHGERCSFPIWMYNLYTEQWSTHWSLQTEHGPSQMVNACAVAITDDVYMFGGRDPVTDYWSNTLWKLSKSLKGLFTWCKVRTKNMNLPSPRDRFTGWEYAGNLWIFGGRGDLPDGYLNDHGEISTRGITRNNQLLCFNPSSEEWTNPECSGQVPTPRGAHATATIRDKVWLYGGYHFPTVLDDFYQLTMSTLVWTQIQTGQPKPRELGLCSLNAITDEQLVLHGGSAGYNIYAVNDTWIFHLPSQTWKKLDTSKKDYHRMSHTASVGINGSVIIIGGTLNFFSCYDIYTDTFNIRLEPKSLQQLALQTINKDRTHLPWGSLPKKLIDLLGTEEDTQQSS